MRLRHAGDSDTTQTLTSLRWETHLAFRGTVCIVSDKLQKITITEVGGLSVRAAGASILT